MHNYNMPAPIIVSHRRLIHKFTTMRSIYCFHCCNFINAERCCLSLFIVLICIRIIVAISLCSIQKEIMFVEIAVAMNK